MRVASDRKDVTVVRCDDNERLIGICHFVCLTNGIGELDGVRQRAVRITRVVSVINSAPLDLQVEPLVVVVNHSDRLLRHLGKRGLPSAVG